MKSLAFYAFVIALYGGIILGLHHDNFAIFYHEIAPSMQSPEQTQESLDMFRLTVTSLLGIFATLAVVVWNIEEQQ